MHRFTHIIYTASRAHANMTLMAFVVLLLDNISSSTQMEEGFNQRPTQGEINMRRLLAFNAVSAIEPTYHVAPPNSSTMSTTSRY